MYLDKLSIRKEKNGKIIKMLVQVYSKWFNWWFYVVSAVVVKKT